MLWKRFMDASCGMRFKPTKSITTHVDLPREFLLQDLDGFSGRVLTMPISAQPST